MSLDEQLAILNAAKDGKVIQWQGAPDCPWWTVGDIDKERFDFLHYRYRIKPELLKALFAYDVTQRVIEYSGLSGLPQVFVATGIGGMYVVHTNSSPLWQSKCHKVRELTRAECEAAGYEWPENAKEPEAKR